MKPFVNLGIWVAMAGLALAASGGAYAQGPEASTPPPGVDPQVRRSRGAAEASESARKIERSGFQYVSAAGNDDDDGLSLATAKRTVYAALESLPGGSSSAPIRAGSGTLYIGPGVSVGAPDGKGLRLVGVGSTEYSHPAPGWIRAGDALTLTCVGGRSGASNSHAPACLEQWGNTNAYPAVQINGSAKSVVFSNFLWQYQGTAITLGVDSTGNRNNGGAQNIRFLGCGGSGGKGEMGWGPQVDIGSNVFWVFFDDVVFYGGCDAWNVSLSRSSNLVTATVNRGACGGTTHDLRDGENVSIRNLDGDTSFNGTFVVTSAPDPQHFTYRQDGPAATLRAAAARGDKSYGITVNPHTGQGSGLIEVNRMAGTGIKFYGGRDGGSMLLRDFTQEGTGAITDPPGLWITCRHGNCGGYANHIEIADSGINASAIVVDGSAANESYVFADMLYPGNAKCTYDGPMTLGGFVWNGACPNHGMSAGATPLRSGARGVIYGTLAGQADDARRGFGPVATRFTNLAPFSGWTLNTGSGGRVATTPGVADPGGTHNAVKYSQIGGSGPNSVNFYDNGSLSVAVGDYLIFGVWTKAEAATGYRSALQFYFSGAGDFAHTYISTPAPGSVDGQWNWNWGISRVTEASRPVHVAFFSSFDSTHPLAAYAPVLMHIPAGAISDNEAYELALHLQSFRSDSTVGQVSLLRGEQFKADSMVSGVFTAALSDGNTRATCNLSLANTCLIKPVGGTNVKTVEVSGLVASGLPYHFIVCQDHARSSAVTFASAPFHGNWSPGSVADKCSAADYISPDGSNLYLIANFNNQ